MKILLVEDDSATAIALTEVLTAHRYSVDAVSDGEVALEMVATFEYNLILLDVILPKLDGIQVCKQLRSQNYTAPILLLTAKDSSGDRVLGLDAGADDYVVKPFDLSELLARLRALLRRGHSMLPPGLAWEKLKFNLSTGSVTYADRPLHLTPKEHGLLELFLLHPFRIFSRSAILDHLWNSDLFPSEEAVNTHIKTLRQKLKAAGARGDFIETIYGMGYRLKPIAQTDHSAESHSIAPSGKTSSQIKQELTAKLSQLKAQFHDGFLAKIAILEQVAAALAIGHLEPEQRQQGKQATHKLAGALGIFGYEEGSTLARKLEMQLELSKHPRAAAEFETLLAALKHELQILPQALPLPNASAVAIHSPPTTQPCLLIVDSDRTLTDLLQIEGNQHNLRLEIVTSPAAVRCAIAHHAPNIVLFDPMVSSSKEEGFRLLAELLQRSPTIPMLVFSQQSDLDDRIAAARLGARAFLQKPMLPSQVFTVVQSVLQSPADRPAKVMVVDDDPSIITALELLLRSHNIEIVLPSSVQQFWPQLTACEPDLLILDVEMPTFNGIELCQVVRADPHWAALPIFMLTAYHDSKTQQQAFAAGADAFISKPFEKTEFVNQITSRLRRARFAT